MTITLAGMAGSGKTTIVKLLIEKLKLKHTSSSQLQRKIAEENGWNINQLGEEQSKSDKMDRMVDEAARTFAKENPDSVIDGWLAPYAVPNSFKIFLKVDTKVAAERRFKQIQEEGRCTECFASVEEAEKMMIERSEVNRKRWIQYYNYDFMDESNYDLVIDTSNMNPESIVNEIIKGHEQYKANEQ